MTAIYTHPDINFDRTRQKVLIRNCDWSEEIIQKIVNNLTDKEYDIYLYHDSVNDYQYFEGIRAMALTKHVYDWRKNKHKDPVEWVKEIDNEF